MDLMWSECHYQHCHRLYISPRQFFLPSSPFRIYTALSELSEEIFWISHKNELFLSRILFLFKVQFLWSNCDKFFIRATILQQLNFSVSYQAFNGFKFSLCSHWREENKYSFHLREASLYQKSMYQISSHISILGKED